jgi:hypothetical protein
MLTSIIYHREEEEEEEEKRSWNLNPATMLKI